MVYRAPAACPGRESYTRQVETRATTLSIDRQPTEPDSTENIRVTVALSEGPEGWLGALDIAEPEALARVVRGDRCDDVVEALALITVLRLEPASAGARGAEAAALDAPQRRPGAELATSSDPRAAPSAASAAAARASAPQAAAAREPAEPSPPSVDSSRTLDAAPSTAEPEAAPLPPDSERSLPPGANIGVPLTSRSSIAAVTAPPAPEASASELEPPGMPESNAPEESVDVIEAEELAPGSATPLRLELAAYVGYASVPSNAIKLALQGEVPLGDTSEWAVSLLLAYTRGTEENSTGTAAFNLWTAQAQLCGPGLSAQEWWLQPCAALRAGFLNLEVARGQDTVEAPGAIRPWAAIGPAFQAGVPLSSEWTLRAMGELAFTLIRDRFQVARGPEPEADAAPSTAPEVADLYQPEALSFELSIGLGYRF